MVEKIRMSPISPMKVPTVVEGSTSPGADVWAKDSVDWMEMISPATDSEAMKTRRTAPIMRPTKISRMTCRAIVPRSAGTAGRTGITTGAMVRVRTRANARRIRTGTAWSPIAGMVMTRAASRVKTMAPA